MRRSLEEFYPGKIALFGSGETSSFGRKVFERLLRDLPPSPRIALLETPAGFELNSPQVIGRVGEFLRHRLQNYTPQVTIVPARRRGTPFSPDNPDILSPLLQAELIFMGPGSPTYAVRQLRDSLAWYYLLARHRLGAILALASAATVAVSAFALPVYEIYKVGEDLHWKEGLDLFRLYGLPLVFIPHWNNNDGGEELDTSRCFMGQVRFLELMAMLPQDLTVIGIDEKTALILDMQAGLGEVIGLGGVTLIHSNHIHLSSPTGEASLKWVDMVEQPDKHFHRFENGERFPLSLCCPFKMPKGGEWIPMDIWQRSLEAQWQLEEQREASVQPSEQPSAEVLALVEERQAARVRKDWAVADQLRQRIAALGWQVQDTAEGPRLTRD